MKRAIHHLWPWLMLAVMVALTLWLRQEAITTLESHMILSEVANAKHYDTHYGVVVVNGESKVMEWNPAMVEITGYTSREASSAGFSIEQLIPQRSREQHHKWFTDAFITERFVGKTIRGNGQMVRKDGSLVSVAIAVRMVRTVSQGLVAKVNVDRIENIRGFNDLIQSNK